MFMAHKAIGCFLLSALAVTSGGSGFGGAGFAYSPAAQWKGSGVSLRGARGICPVKPVMMADSSDRNVVEEYRQILKDLDENPPERARGKNGKDNWFKSIAQKASKLKTCETDYDCNSGGRNYPLRCVNFVVANFCVDSDDWTGGNGIRDLVPELAPELIPVRVEDGYVVNPGDPGWPGSR